MGSERLNGLELMHMHSRIAKDIYVEQVLREFDSSGHRRIVLAFQATAGSEVKHDENWGVWFIRLMLQLMDVIKESDTLD